MRRSLNAVYLLALAPAECRSLAVHVLGGPRSAQPSSSQPGYNTVTPSPNASHGRHHPFCTKTVAVVVVVFCLFLLAFSKFILLRKFCSERRARRRARCAQLGAKRHRTGYTFSRLVFSRPHELVASRDDEKVPILDDSSDEKAHNSDSAKTMGQDLASFRVAADLVGEMIAAEEGRARAVMSGQGEQPNQGLWRPSRPGGAHDEPLPAYEENSDRPPITFGGDSK